MEHAVFILVLCVCLTSSAPIESGAKGEVAEIEKKNFIPMRHLIKGTVLLPNGQGYPTGTNLGQAQPQNQGSTAPCQCPPYQQMGYYQQYQYQPYYQNYQAPQQRNMVDYSKCPCYYPAPNRRPLYPHRPLPNIQGAPNVIDLSHLLRGRLQRPPFWGARQLKKIAAAKAAPKPRPAPAKFVLPPGVGKNGYGYTGWVKAAIPKPNQWNRQQQWNNYWRMRG